jgi:tRNA(Arg) A34 adenosine deaminase TadA
VCVCFGNFKFSNNSKSVVRKNFALPYPYPNSDNKTKSRRRCKASNMKKRKRDKDALGKPEEVVHDKMNKTVAERATTASGKTFAFTEEDMVLNLYLSDWECLQRGLAILRKYKNKLHEHNLIRIAPYVLNGKFHGADSVSKSIASKKAENIIVDTKYEKSKKTNIGDIMNQIISNNEIDGLSKLKRIENTLMEIIDRNGNGLKRSLLISSFATAVIKFVETSVNKSKSENSNKFLNYVKKILCFIPELKEFDEMVDDGTISSKNSDRMDMHNQNQRQMIDVLSFMFSPEFLKQIINLQIFPTLKSLSILEQNATYQIIKAGYEAALRGNQRGAKHGAILFHKDGHILSIGWNHRYQVPIKKTGSKVMHAEVHCLMQLKSLSDANGGTIYIIEPNLENNLTFYNAQPCRQCTIALAKVGVNNAIYTSAEGRMKKLSIKENNDEDVEAGSLNLALRFKSKERGDATVLKDIKL